MLKRVLKEKIESKLGQRKAIILIGPRQVGKTTLIKEICKERERYLFLDGDDLTIRKELSEAGKEKISRILTDHDLVFVDEGQRISDIGIFGKIIVDQFPGVQLIISGSSALDIANSLNEPLTGRKWEFRLYPISIKEYYNHFGYLKLKSSLGELMTYGMYPEVITNKGSEIEILKSIVDGSLFKEVLTYGNIRKPEVIENLLRALAFQVGHEVSYNELSNLLMIDRETVERYLTLLEKAYIIFRLTPLSKNLRNEITSSRKYYFYDLGVRNYIISNFTSIENRTDIGALWENFMVVERLKQNAYLGKHVNSFFWRTYQQQEIDLIEEVDGQYHAFEFKYNPKRKAKISKTFSNNYNMASALIINSENFYDHLLAD